jgi:hypothetical protein
MVHTALTVHLLLYLLAFVFFIVAACPTGSRFGWQWFAFAALTLTLIV